MDVCFNKLRIEFGEYSSFFDGGFFYVGEQFFNSSPELLFKHPDLLVADMLPFHTAVFFAYALLR